MLMIKNNGESTINAGNDIIISRTRLITGMPLGNKTHVMIN